MGKNIYLTRYSLIIKRLEKGAATYEQINEYLQKESELQQLDYTVSLRTLQRDIKDIYSLLDYEIVNEKAGENRYYIKERPEEIINGKRLLENFQMSLAIRLANQYHHYIIPEKRQPIGMENFYGLLHAIINKRILLFSHYKYWDETLTHRKVHPLALKESQGRWYLVAVDTNGNKLKTFGLDRIQDIEISNTEFKENYEYDLNAMFDECFGIINSAEVASIVRLSFTYEQGQYVKNYPLHHSQTVISETDDCLVVELNIKVTHDFIMEILSFGADIKVLQPYTMAEFVSNILKDSLKQYEEGK